MSAARLAVAALGLFSLAAREALAQESRPAPRAQDSAALVVALRALAADGRTNDALDRCQEALLEHPHDAALLCFMAEVSSRRAEQLLSTQGGSSTAGLYLEDALAYAERARNAAPDSRVALALYANALFRLGHVDRAFDAARALTERWPRHAGGFLLLGELLFKRYRDARTKGERKEDALEELAARTRRALTRARDLDPKRTMPHRRLGDLAGWLGEPELSRRHWAEALARDPERGAPTDWLRREVASPARAELYEHAIERRRLLGLSPAGVATLAWHAGLARFEKGDWRACRAHMELARKGHPDWWNTYYYAGIASFQLGELRAAAEAFATYAAAEPARFAEALTAARDAGKGHAAILARLADLAHATGHPGASRDLNHVAALYEDTAERWNNYAFLCRETGAYEASWKGYLRALEVAPDDPQILNDAAVILQYHLHRDLGKARKMYERAIVLGKKVLARARADASAKARARQAIADARGNLAKLGR